MKKSNELSTPNGSTKKPVYIVMEERGFYSGYAKYENLNDALDNMSYNILYIAHQINDETLKKWKAVRELDKKL